MPGGGSAEALGGAAGPGRCQGRGREPGGLRGAERRCSSRPRGGRAAFIAPSMRSLFKSQPRLVAHGPCATAAAATAEKGGGGLELK